MLILNIEIDVLNQCKDPENKVQTYLYCICIRFCLVGCLVFLQDRRYADLTEDQLPACESLKDTIARALPFWNEEIVPQIKEGKRVLIAAHGNSLRGIVKHLEGNSSTVSFQYLSQGTHHYWNRLSMISMSGKVMEINWIFHIIFLDKS